MKYNFDKCLEMVLKHEGGYVNHSKDPGGETNLGVTHITYSRWLEKPVTTDMMKALTPKDVAPIYKAQFWNVCRCDDLPSGLDWLTFDWGVNSGPSRAAKALQEASGATVDGHIGPNTIKHIKDFPVSDLIRRVSDLRLEFYQSLKTFDTFGKGWTRRCEETKEAALEMIET